MLVRPPAPCLGAAGLSRPPVFRRGPDEGNRQQLSAPRRNCESRRPNGVRQLPPRVSLAKPADLPNKLTVPQGKRRSSFSHCGSPASAPVERQAVCCLWAPGTLRPRCHQPRFSRQDLRRGAETSPNSTSSVLRPPPRRRAARPRPRAPAANEELMKSSLCLTS